MKRKTITLVASLLICISLIGVGFAAWVISAPGELEIPGNIQVDTVTDHRLQATVKGEVPSIVFGRPTEMNFANAWLTSNGVPVENLTSTFEIEVTRQDEGTFTAAELNAASVAFKGNFLTSGAVKSAMDADYITTPTVGVSAPTVTATGSKTTATYTVTITFAWGTEFGSTNPYTYFNSKGVNELKGENLPTWGTIAKGALTGIYALNTVEIPIVFSVSFK